MFKNAMAYFSKYDIAALVGPARKQERNILAFLQYVGRSRHKLLIDRLLSQGYEMKRLRNSFKVTGIGPIAPVQNRGPLEDT